MQVKKLMVETYTVEDFHVEYTNVLPIGNYLVFPVTGYTATMRDVGVPSKMEFNYSQSIYTRYDFYEQIDRGDNTYPRKGDQLGWIIDLDEDNSRIENLDNSIEKLELEISKLKAQIKPKAKTAKKGK